MTHHEHPVKEIAADLVKKIRSGKRINEEAKCNWCTRGVNQFKFFDERNFVPVQGRVVDGKQALALFGDCCIYDAKKVNDIKYAIRVYKDTDGVLRAEQIDVRFLEHEKGPEPQPVERPQMPEPEDTGSIKEGIAEPDGEEKNSPSPQLFDAEGFDKKKHGEEEKKQGKKKVGIF